MGPTQLRSVQTSKFFQPNVRRQATYVRTVNGITVVTVDAQHRAVLSTPVCLFAGVGIDSPLDLRNPLLMPQDHRGYPDRTSHDER